MASRRLFDGSASFTPYVVANSTQVGLPIADIDIRNFEESRPQRHQATMGAATLSGLAYGAAVLATILMFLVSPVAAAGIDGSTILLIEGVVLAVLLVVLIARDRAEG